MALAILFSVASIASAKKKHPPPPKHPPVTAPAPAPEPAEPSASPTMGGTTPGGSATSPASAPVPSPSPPPPPSPLPPPPPEPPPRAEPTRTETPPESSRAKVDFDALSGEYQALRDDLFRSRAKVELLGSALYKTRLLVFFRYKAQRAWPLKRVQLKLDDQPVFASDSPNAADDYVRLYEGFPAPGRHVLAVHVDCGATGETRVAYGADSSFTLDVPDGKQQRVNLTVDETGSGPQRLAQRKSGSFEVRIDADLMVQDIGEK